MTENVGPAGPSGKPSRRRSCLSVPGSSEKMLAKAPTLGADELILDLEDAVTPARKEDARAMVVAALAASGWADTPASVRINAPGTPWSHLDIIALASAATPPAALVIPKVEGVQDLAFVERLLDGVEAGASDGRRMRVQALIENAAGLAHVQEIAAGSSRLDSLIIGYADLAASLGRSRAAALDLSNWLPTRESVLLAARANGLQAIDGPHLGVSVDAAFEAGVRVARELGFDGKWAIHPSQVCFLNESFTPSSEEIARARAVLAALEDGERDGARGAVALDGEMLDEAVRAAALRTLANAAELP